MIKEGSLCKNFKGKSLLDKNIYIIIFLKNNGKEIDSNIKYTGVGELEKATNLVIYMNIFNGMLFARELDDFIGVLDMDKQKELKDAYPINKLTEYLENIKDKTAFKNWYFGHYHKNKKINNKFICLYDDIIDFK